MTGDTTRIKGSVTDKRIEGEEYWVRSRWADKFIRCKAIRSAIDQWNLDRSWRNRKINIANQSCPNLNLDSIRRGPYKGFDLKILVQCLKKRFPSATG